MALICVGIQEPGTESASSHLILLLDLLKVTPSFDPRTPQSPTFLQPLPAQMVADDGE